MLRLPPNPVVLGLLVGLLVCRTVYTCSCIGPLHPQNIICSSNFVAKVKVEAMHPEGYEFDYNYEDFFDEDEFYVNYTVKVVTKYKREKKYRKNKPVHVMTGRSGSLCGVYLKVGTTYIIGGTENDDGVHIDSCGSFIAEPATMNNKIKKYLKKKKYIRNCKCEVEVCSEFYNYGDEICPSGDSMSCSMDYDSPEAECYLNSYCAKKGGMCKWKDTC